MTIKTRKARIVALARDQHEDEGDVEIDDAPRVSEGDDNGAYVAAWVWVDFTGTELDKDPTPPAPRSRCPGCFSQLCQDCRPSRGG